LDGDEEPSLEEEEEDGEGHQIHEGMEKGLDEDNEIGDGPTGDGGGSTIEEASFGLPGQDQSGGDPVGQDQDA
jgi:hypothetical protein